MSYIEHTETASDRGVYRCDSCGALFYGDSVEDHTCGEIFRQMNPDHAYRRAKSYAVRED